MKRASAKSILWALAGLIGINVLTMLCPRVDYEAARVEADAFEDFAAVRDARQLALALHVVASHGRVFDAETVQRMLDGPERVLTDLAMTHDFSRGEAIDVQRAWRKAHPDDVSTSFFFGHRGRRTRRADLRDYLESVSK